MLLPGTTIEPSDSIRPAKYEDNGEASLFLKLLCCKAEGLYSFSAGAATLCNSGIIVKLFNIKVLKSIILSSLTLSRIKSLIIQSKLSPNGNISFACAVLRKKNTQQL